MQNRACGACFCNRNQALSEKSGVGPNASFFSTGVNSEAGDAYFIADGAE